MNWKPTRKVNVGVVTGAIVVAAVWAVQTFSKTTVPAEVASALTTLLTFIVSWVVPDDMEE